MKAPQTPRGLLKALLAGFLALLLAGSTSRPLPGPSSVPPSSSPASSSPATAPSPSAGPTNPFLLRVPTFPPAPKAVPITLHGGPAAPFFARLPTTQRVAFLTIDDGWIRTPQAIALMEAANIPFTMFLIAPLATQNADYFRELTKRGGSIGDHTITHPSLRGRSYDFQHHEMCDSATMLAKTFGSRPLLFRPPFGNYDTTTLRVAHDCGYTAVLNWSETVDKGIVRYQTAKHEIRPGDIILMHFRPAFVDDVLAALQAIHAAGLTPAVLGDYLVVPHSA